MFSRMMSAETSYELWTNGQVPYVIQSNTYSILSILFYLKFEM